MIIHVTFKVNEEEARKVLEGCGMRMTNEPRCIDRRMNQSVWCIYCSRGYIQRWRLVKHVGRITNALTKEVYYEGIFPTLNTFKDESTVY